MVSTRKHNYPYKITSKLVKHNNTSSKKNKTSRHIIKGNKKNKISPEKKAHIVRIFIEMLNIVKLYHWKTKSYPQHKATDELYEKLNTNIDRFVEVLLGKDESRIKMVEKRMVLIEAENTKGIKAKIHEYRSFLIDMNRFFDKDKDSDLLSIRDDILESLNQFLYLLTLK
jgi:hypothetical protein